MKNNSHARYPLLPLILATSLALLNSAGTAEADQFNYNLNADWSDIQNPNGAWSYNYNETPIAQYQTLFWGQGAWGAYDFGEAAILKGIPPSGIDPFGGVVPPPYDWIPGDVMMHAVSLPYGGDYTFLNVRWTSPGDGMIDITGRAWDGMIIQYPDRDVAWALIVGGQTVAQRSSVTGVHRIDPNAPFAANLTGYGSLTGVPVVMGDIVEFRVIANTYYGQFVGIEENITLTAVPEVGSAQLFLLGLGGLAFARKFRLRSGHNPAAR